MPQLHLTDRDKEIIREHLDANEPLPPKYRLMLFADAPEVELIWQGKVKREVLTRKWTDWIDYWAVDFDFENRKDIIRITDHLASGESPGAGGEREVWTGNYVFENEWQSFRTRKDRRLEMASAAHEYPRKGTYKIAVNVIDIFGNDTTKVVEVKA